MKRFVKDPLFYYFLICIVLATAPFFVWHIKIYFITFFSFFLVSFWGVEKSSIYRISLLPISCFYLFAFSNFYGDTNIIGKCLYLFPMLLYLIRGSVWAKTYDVFWKLYSYALIPSLLVYFVVVFGGVDLPSFTLQPYNEIKDYDYTVYPFYIVSNEFSSFGIENFRFSAYFDEPGVVGTMSGVIFTVNRCSLKDWKNWPILISGIFSFSLFFYLLVLLYILVWGERKYKYGVAIVLITMVTYLITLEDNLFKDLILSRFTIEDGEWVGNNRTKDSFELFFDSFMNSDYKWFGYGTKYCSTVVDPDGASYKYLIVDHGLIPFFLYISGVILYYFSLCKLSKKFLFLAFVFFSIVFQRHFLVFGLQGIFMFLSPCYVYNDSNNQRITSKQNRITSNNISSNVKS